MVWYDPGGTLQDLAEGAIPREARLLRFRGSYLELRLELEEEDPLLRDRWIVYVPRRPPERSWLRDWELAGERLELDLAELLRRGGLPLTERLRRWLRDQPRNARELAPRLADCSLPFEEEAVGKELLALALGLPTWQEGEAILLFLADQGAADALRGRGLWEMWTERVRAWAGLPLPEEPRELRERLAALILLAELPLELGVPLPPGEARQRAAHLAALWRSREDLRDAYLRAAEEVERAYEVERRLRPTPDLERLETLACVDRVLLGELRRSIGPRGEGLEERAERVASLAASRQKRFWARAGRAPFWQPIARAAELLVGAKGALGELGGCRGLEGLLARYAGEDDGWWRLDRLALELAACEEELSRQDRSRFVRKAWIAYGEWLDALARRMAEEVEREGWRPDQPRFWAEHVRGRGRAAVLFADALRYDLAVHLRDLLEREGFEVELRWLRGVLPSVTELGMAALLPEAEQGLELAADDGLRVRLAGREVSVRSERRSYLEERGVRAVERDELESAGGAERLVVFSRQVDEFGTFAADLHPRGLLEMVEGIGRDLCRLRDLGFERLLVVADHGFLFLPAGVGLRTIEAREVKLRKRRFAVGAALQGCVVKRAEELGLGGGKLLSFPKGLAVFSLPGEPERFLHGGLSPQELVVPLLVVRPKEGPMRVEVIMEVPDPLTSRLAQVRVRARPGSGPSPRRVLVEIYGRRSHEIEVGPEGEETLAVTWLRFDEDPPERVTVRLLDAETEQLLDEREVSVSMIM